MTHVHDLPTEVRLLEVGTLAVIVDFHDPENGVDVGGKLRKPVLNQRQARIKSARAHGSYGIGARLDDDGEFVIPVLVFGSSWGQTEQRFLDLIDAVRSADRFYIETVLSGVTTRWYCDAPVDFEEVVTDRKNNRQRYDLVFLVQPNPSVSIA
jgi:hypothetical protein